MWRVLMISTTIIGIAAPIGLLAWGAGWWTPSTWMKIVLVAFLLAFIVYYASTRSPQLVLYAFGGSFLILMLLRSC